MKQLNYLKSQNADYIDELFARYQADPNSVDESWRFFFEGLELAIESGTALPTPPAQVAGNGPVGTPVTYMAAVPSPAPGTTPINSEAKVGELIQHYRELGIMLANINPLTPAPTTHPLLELAAFELTAADLDRKFTAAKRIGFAEPATLRDIIARLRETYCGPIGVEYTHIQDPAAREWLQTLLETTKGKTQLSKAAKTRVLQKLTEAESFERFLHTRYVAQKRFSIEGGDALIPMLDCLITESAALGAQDFVLGMAHRGRLNVLTNIFGKKYEFIFGEFEGNFLTDTKAGEGDVKYHMGFSADHVTPRGDKIHLSLASNPSHLEFVNPVIEGVARAKQRLRSVAAGGKDPRTSFKNVIPVTIHGDAAFAGQGIVYETIQLSLLNGYSTGGSIRIVVNNQVGFTTLPRDSRSTTYATDLAKMLETPIFHVNGDDAEAVYYVTQLATQFRQTFHRDVVIDLLCYRKYGHNEGDEPSYTQPLMYKQIKDHASPREIYVRQLLTEGSLTQAEVQAELDKMNERLTASHAIAKTSKEPPQISVFEGAWKGLRKGTDEDLTVVSNTKVDEKTLREIGKKLVEIPATFHVHPKLVRLIEQRGKQVEEGKGIDWGTGEALAYGSLVAEGTHVRLSGQDSERGTFSHRHSVLYDTEDNSSFVPLNHIKPGQAEYAVMNSFLSESAVLGFEYGHALADPMALTIWEAQFGDFANGAQVIIDQFIASSESKWQRMCGLVMLLPHGYEGQGPEHSSARLERFLQLCARNNMQICNFTTPAQLFHGLRRQIHRDYRKPLVLMSPKSLLRHPQAVSSLSDFSEGHFQEVIDDPLLPKNPRRVIFCSGKIYYDLAAARLDRKITDVAIVRVEQMYPWPAARVAAVTKQYDSATELSWVQEEPRNMGAWNFVRDYLGEHVGGTRKLSYVGRGPAAAPAVGSSKIHEKEQKSIVEEALK